MTTFILLFYGTVSLMADPVELRQARLSYEKEKALLDEKYVVFPFSRKMI